MGSPHPSNGRPRSDRPEDRAADAGRPELESVEERRTGHDTSDLLGREAAADRANRTGAARPGAREARPEAREPRPEADRSLDHALEELGERHPDVASLARRLAADPEHPLDLTEDLLDPARRERTIATLSELADGRLLAGQSLADYREANPGRGPLFERIPPEVNLTALGESRKQTFIDHCKEVDPARQIGGTPSDAEAAMVADYRDELQEEVLTHIWDEVKEIADQFDGVDISGRVKSAPDIVDKVARMSEGSAGRPGRPDYRVGDVVDAMGIRLTARDTEQLERLLAAVDDRLGTGDAGRILEKENMYLSPKGHNPAYRVVPLIATAEVGPKPYILELQLCTRRASIAADMEHNTIYKEHLGTSESEQARVRRMQAEAAALDQEETRSRWP